MSVEEVRESGLIKDQVELWAPEHKTSSMKSVELEKACERLGEVSREWDLYCSENHLPSVNPLLIVQVEDKISEHALGELCETICASLPWLDRTNCFANVFGDKKDLLTPFAKIPYCPHDRVSDQTEIRVLFAKQAITTGWDCPRAEVLFS